MENKKTGMQQPERRKSLLTFHGKTRSVKSSSKEMRRQPCGRRGLKYYRT
jgi:hypothetical protein